MSGLKRTDELLLRDLKAAVDTHGLDSLSEDDQLVFSLLNDRYDKFLDEGLKKLRGTPSQKRGLLSSIFNRGPQVPSSERRKARMSMAASTGLTSPQVAPSDAPSGVTNDSMVNGLQMTNGSFFVGNDSMAAAPAAALDGAAGSGGGDPADATPMSPPRAHVPTPTVDPTVWFASPVGDQEYLGKHWNWVLPNLVVGAIPFAAPTRDTPGHLSELNEQCQRRQSRITSVISCLGLDEPVGPDGFATAKEWESILSVSTFVHAPIPRERDAVLVHYEDEDSSAGEAVEAQPDIEGLPPIRKVTLETLTLFEDVLAACKHITDKTTDPTTAEISEMVRFKVGGGKKAGANTPPQGGVPTGSFGAAGSFASDGSDPSPPLPMPTLSPTAEGATTTNDGSGATPTVMMGVVVREDSTSPVHQHHDPANVMQASTTSSIGDASSAVLSGSIVAPPPPPSLASNSSTFIPPPHLSTGISSDVSSSPMRAASPTSMGSPLQSVKRRLGGDQHHHSGRKASVVVGPRSVAYLHCKAGCARSYIIATAYLISQHGRTHEEADKFMRCMRTQFNPSENQIAFLKAFEEFVSRPYVRPPSVEEERYQQVLADILSLSPEMRMRLLSDVEKLT